MQSRSSVTTMHNWLDDEVGARTALRQTFHLVRRGLRHPWLALVLTVLLTSGCIATLIAVRDYYRPRLVLRVIEADRDPHSMPRPKRQLRAYVSEGIFTSQLLLDVIRRHDLYPDLMQESPPAAVAEFRKDIAVDVYQNYFVEDRAPGDPPRSVRVAVSYRSTNGDLAQAVTRDLGSLIVQRELEMRRLLATAAAHNAAVARETLKRTLAERSKEVLIKQHQIEQSREPNPQLQVELVGSIGSLAALERQVLAAERHSASLDLGAALEQHGMGLSFQIVEDATLPSSARRRDAELLAAAVTMVLGFPFVVLAIGAFAHPKRGYA
ncbi:MAG TPA: hypothetical protein VHO25_10600 [Polyangiaceae bacterium]|nr:hypothetical protein [Polyangiaceae bacterium]